MTMTMMTRTKPGVKPGVISMIGGGRITVQCYDTTYSVASVLYAKRDRDPVVHEPVSVVFDLNGSVARVRPVG